MFERDIAAAEHEELLASHERLRVALGGCLSAMVEYGDGGCGPHCEAMIEGPTPFPDEIDTAREALAQIPKGE